MKLNNTAMGLTKTKHCSPDFTRAILIAGLHGLAALAYKAAGILTLPAFDWSQSWHLMPADLLQHDLARTLWDLHAQPPLYNLIAGLFLKIFGLGTPNALFFFHILLGAIMCALVYLLLRQWITRPATAFAWAAVLAMNPAIFLFEAQIGYDLLTAFWVVLATALFAYSAFIPCVITLNLLILTRGLFHPILLLPALLLIALTAGPRKRRILAVSLIICLISLGWCAKNTVRFGTFSVSSWAGQNLWTHVCANYNRQDLETFIHDGILDRTVLDIPVWSRPEAYQHAGFNRTSDHPALSRNNYNNINIPAISRLYGANALRLIRHRPCHYLINTAKAYRIFCEPASRSKYVRGNAARMRWHETAASQILQGQALTRSLSPLASHKDPFMSLWFFALPALLLLFFARILRLRQTQPWPDRLRTQAPLCFIAGLILFTTLIACTCDYGENGRFRFAIEPITWVFLAALIHTSGHARHDT